MKFLAKYVIAFFLLSLLALLPPTISIVAHTILLGALFLLLLSTLCAAQYLSLLRIPSFLKTKKGAARFYSVNYNGLRVFYTPKLNGGGLGLAYEFKHLVETHVGKTHHVFEYCAGPGFVGFNLLAYKLCDKLTLSDVNPEAIEAIQKTIKENKLEDRVTVYQSDCLDGIPAEARWDLAVSNPPWDLRSTNEKNLVLCDPIGRVHKKFFQDISKFLNPHASIIFGESHEYTRQSDMRMLMEGTDVEVERYVAPVKFSKILSGFRQYAGLPKCLIMNLRLAISMMEIYFVQCRVVGVHDKT